MERECSRGRPHSFCSKHINYIFLIQLYLFMMQVFLSLWNWCCLLHESDFPPAEINGFNGFMLVNQSGFKRRRSSFIINVTIISKIPLWLFLQAAGERWGPRPFSSCWGFGMKSPPAVLNEVQSPGWGAAAAMYKSKRQRSEKEPELLIWKDAANLWGAALSPHNGHKRSTLTENRKL